jgi:predicted phage baseplate assembly protein
MTLPAPELDDRRFQDIVDEAKRKISQLCPTWTDHNVSDPGVALIELFAWMSEMVLYRMNQVPDRLYVKFLELVGIELYGAAPATTDLLFRLTAPQQDVVRVAEGTQVSTERVGQEDPVVFMTDQELRVVPPRLTSCLTLSGDQFEDHTEDLRRQADRVTCFRSVRPGDAFYLGFAESLAANQIRLHVVTQVEGAGVMPEDAPLRWETWEGERWVTAELVSDDSDALNAPEGGDITLILGPRHEQMPINLTRAFWLRCRLVPSRPGQPGYQRSPQLSSVTVESVGGVVRGRHAEPAPAEVLGLSNGLPGQVFAVRRAPVLERDRSRETVRVLLPRGHGQDTQRSEDWSEVEHFGGQHADDRVFTWSGATGEIRFGPRTEDASGRAEQHGAVPPVDAQVTVTGYRCGGGRRGNVGAGKLRVLRTSIPFVAEVTNRGPATGGVDTETVENAKVRGPMALRSGDRAVTVEDFEHLTLDAAPTVSRARCIPPQPGQPIRVLVVPRVSAPVARLKLADFALPPELVRSIAAHLDARRLLTAQVSIAEPRYQGVMVVAQVRPVAGMREESIRERAVSALYDFLNPVTGGSDHQGWPFGGSLMDGDIHALLRGVQGVATVTRVYFFLVDLRTLVVSPQEHQRIALSPDTLLMSHQHQIVVET